MKTQLLVPPRKRRVGEREWEKERERARHATGNCEKCCLWRHKQHNTTPSPLPPQSSGGGSHTHLCIANTHIYTHVASTFTFRAQRAQPTIQQIAFCARVGGKTVRMNEQTGHTYCQSATGQLQQQQQHQQRQQQWYQFELTKALPLLCVCVWLSIGTELCPSSRQL